MDIQNYRDAIFQAEISKNLVEKWSDIFISDLRRVNAEGLNEETLYAIENSRAELQKAIAKLNYPVVRAAELMLRNVEKFSTNKNSGEASK